MQLWVGLGNPGAKYAMNRHNVGFMAVDAIAEVHGFEASKKRFAGWAIEARLGAGKLLLLKREPFMKESGQAIGEAMRFYRLEPAAVNVLHHDTQTSVMSGTSGAGRVNSG